MTPLEQAARAAQHAPSVFNTQPWNWQITGNTLELFADPGRRVDSIDPDGRLLLLSCGAALHHARTYLAAAGWSVTVERMPDAERPQLLARVTLGHPIPPDPESTRMAAAIARRRTDRRAFDDRPVTEFELTKLRRFVESEGAYLHTVRPDQVAMLAISTEIAAGAELDDPAYKQDLHRWTARPSQAGDGVPPGTAVKPELRRVPVRDFFPDATAKLEAGAAHDQGAAYVVLFGLDDEPKNLLRGGEALSALLLLATADGLATAPLSDAVEVEWPRHLVRGLIAGIGEPYLVVRLGYRHDRQPVPAAPRRDTADVITTTR
ncbi:NAD(P)H nitroreductase [Paractinoplanes abujensis]|uniref:Nitroreductase n=1 Tax=Paractinoplanes abujensis TaxID=882441 RepID=A0A7W7G2A7_9ACTN|nr:nitroreductase [Actinoplanes abujensis]MBB4693489.1 nitroreductase [Actinoplanes abujensis]GID21852.1 NAD(P)H nitroreductase [Actinoplanes abujensis]